MKSMIEKYCDIYSSPQKLPKKIKFSNFILKKKKNQYFAMIEDIYLSAYYFDLASEDINNPDSDGLFILFILLSCFDIDFKFRVMSKTKLIILMNLIYSNSINRSDLLKKLLKTHGVSDDLENTSFLFVDDAVVYIKDDLKMNLNDIQHNLTKHQNTLELQEKISLFLKKLSQKNKNLDFTHLDFMHLNNDEIIYKVMKNQIQLSGLMTQHLDKTIEIFEYCLKYYRFGTWQSTQHQYMSLYYQHKKIENLTDILENKNCKIKFECEYFIESFILNISSIEIVDYIHSKLKVKNNKIKFNFLLFKSDLSNMQIKKYIKKYISLYKQ